MRGGFSIGLIMALLVAGGYFMVLGERICPVPLAYRVGNIDERFAISQDELRADVATAEAVWEEASDRELFVYDETSDFTINLLYDERQAFTDAEMEERARLENTESASSAIEEEYEKLVAKYDELQRQHESAAAAYEADLAAYNEEVDKYNESGGVPPKAYERLLQEEERLAATREELETNIAKLNRLVEEINTVSDRGNRLIETYNRGVDQFNTKFNTHREFTQGTYRNDGRIDIYTFTSREELRLVLAHELGHALSIDHVAGTDSIMYFMIGDQPTDLVPSEEDIVAFNEVCKERSFWDTIVVGFRTAFNI